MKPTTLVFLLGAAGAALVVGLEFVLPASSTAFTGYSAKRVQALRAEGLPLTFTYRRWCEGAAHAPHVQVLFEQMHTGTGPRRTLAYENRFSNPLNGTSRETGIRGWRGVFTPRFLEVAQDTPPGEFDSCALLSPAATPAMPILAGVASGIEERLAQTAWKVAARNADQVPALAAHWERLRAQAARQGPAWSEQHLRAVDHAGAELLRKEEVTVRYSDGGALRMEFSASGADASIKVERTSAPAMP